MSWKVKREKVVVTEFNILSVWECFMKYEILLRNRTRTQQKTASECALCDNPFNDKDMVHLAIGKGGNVIICDNCLEEAKNNNVPVSKK